MQVMGTSYEVLYFISRTTGAAPERVFLGQEAGMTDKSSRESLAREVERLQAEVAALKANRPTPPAAVSFADLQLMADLSQDAVYYYDLVHRRFVFMNKLFRETFGRELKENEPLTTGHVNRTVHPDDRAGVGRLIFDSLEPGRVGGEVDYRIMGSQGQVRWLNDRWTVIRDKKEKAVAILGLIRDFTDRKMADAALEASKQSALIGVYIVQDGRFQYMNPEFVKITGYTEAELRRMPSMDLVHEDFREYVRTNAVRMLKGQRSIPYEFCVLNQAGEIRWIMETVTPVQYNGRRAALGYFMDVTRLRDMQHNLSSLGLMIGAVSHSLKGCLTGLDAGLYLIDSGFYREKPARIEEGLDAVRLMVDRVKKLVYDVLYYVKERGLNRESVNVHQFAQNVAAFVETRMRGANIDFNCRFDPDLGEFEVDAELLRTALINILENGMEACIDDHSRVSHRIDFTVRAQGDDVLFGISDNGPGMDRDQVRDAFIIFYSSKGGKGTGLGLFITKKVIRQHGGQISLESTPGQGTTFRISIPRLAGKS
jgi:PAS domain S-box-containing protein